MDAIAGQIRDTMRADPRPYLPLIGTLFLFILTANWSSLVPGIEPPTAHLETDAALALIVFVAIAWFGIRARGVGRLARQLRRTDLLMLPLNLVESFTRTFSLLVRLFGNVMSGVFVIGIVLSLAGLLVPVPLMALELLTGAVQAYIFSVLAMVFIGGAVGEAPQTQRSKAHELDRNRQHAGRRLGGSLRRDRAGPGRGPTPSPPRWTPSPASRKRPTRCRARCSSAWR